MTTDKTIIDRDTFKQLTLSAEEELANSHLHAALGIVGNLLDTLTVLPERAPLKEACQQTSSDYERLLHYMAKGTDDPQRNSLQHRLTQKTFGILQDLRRQYDLLTLNNAYTTTAHEYWDNWNRNGFFPLLKRDYQGNFEAQDHLFNVIWTAPQLLPNEETELALMLLAADVELRNYMLSALSLSLIHYFDAAKVHILKVVTVAETPSERARAMLGIVLGTHLHRQAASLYPSLLDDILSGGLVKPEEIAVLQHHFCLYLETDRIHEKMEKEIIPTLIRVTQQRRKMGFDDMEIDLSDSASDLNISRKTKKKLAEGILEMARLSQEGMDVNLHTFTALKKFPFFQSVSHWLAPFNSQRISVPATGIFSELPLCDSDKYSAALLYNLIPSEQRDAMSKAIEAHGLTPNTEEPNLKTAVQNVVQCLYRLMRRSPWVGMWPDVFTMDMLFIDNPVLGPELRQNDMFLIETGLLLLRNKHYKEAERHLELYAERKGTDFDLLMQLGVCAQEQGNFRKAINLFQQANMLRPQQPNALYRLQYCQARTEQYRAQCDTLLELEKLLPEDPKITTETGLCLIQLEAWDEALKRFYKLEVTGKNLVPSMRAIAWCHLRLHQFPEAEKYYSRIAEEFPASLTWEDRLNAGHVAWVCGDMKTALQRYTDYVHHYASANPEETNLMRPFESDRALLLELGFSADDIGLMYDLISSRFSPKT